MNETKGLAYRLGQLVALLLILTMLLGLAIVIKLLVVALWA